jgi:LmbE family N-acetylglucosaminyl deacetylase
MQKVPFKDGDPAAVIVAHPDDETIWMGGAILLYPKMRWTIISLCRASDHDRAPKFRKVCAAFGARAIIADLDDEGRISPEDAVQAAAEIIKEKIGGKKFEYIFTHGVNGEYGHYLHKAVHEAVRNSFNSGKISAKKLVFFHYRKASSGKSPSMDPRRGAELILPLSPALFRKKRAMMSAIYGFDPKGIDASLCTNPEAFITY